MSAKIRQIYVGIKFLGVRETTLFQKKIVIQIIYLDDYFFRTIIKPMLELHKRHKIFLEAKIKVIRLMKSRTY